MQKKIFSENEKKTQILISDDYVKRKFEEKTKLCYVDTGSFIVNERGAKWKNYEIIFCIWSKNIQLFNRSQQQR